MSAIAAVSRNVKTLADGTLRLTIDIEPNNAQEAFKYFGMPDVPMAIARLTQEASIEHAQTETINEPKGGAGSQWLAIRCGEPEFWRFLESKTECKDWHGAIEVVSDADEVVKQYLSITSKKELDNDKAAEKRFHEMIRKPYTDWLAGKR